MKKELIAFLNKQVANYGLLYTKLHNYHWLVKGICFTNSMKNLKNFMMR